MSNHTHGPWQVWRLAPESHSKELMIVVSANAEDEVTGLIYNDADAHLIAAAPDMLAVCEESYQLVTLLLDIASVELEMDLVELLGDNLAKAIRKAKGGADE